MKTILGNSRYDFLFLIFPGILGIIVALAFPQTGLWSWVLLFTFLFVDSGHVYTTFLRTHFKNPQPQQFKQLNLITLFIFIFLFIFTFLMGHWIWPLIVYLTLFHHIRQHYGIVRWYEGEKAYAFRNAFFYILLLLPLFAFHFRPSSGSSEDIMYSENDFFLYPSPQLLSLSIGAFGLIFIIWFALSILKSKIAKQQLIYELTAISVYGFAGFYAKSFQQASIPLFFSHGIPYMSLMIKTLPKTNGKAFHTYLKATFAVILVAVVFGGIEYYTEGHYLEELFDLQNYNFLYSLIIALYLTPLLSHYIYDGIIWRRRAAENKLIYE